LFCQAQIVLTHDTINLEAGHLLLDTNNNIKENQSIKFKVCIKNSGNKPLTITRCFGEGYFSEPLKKPISPNGEDSLKIIIYRYEHKKETSKGMCFWNPIIISGNFPELNKVIYVKGYYVKKE
jgi:hypothetical protein